MPLVPKFSNKIKQNMELEIRKAKLSKNGGLEVSYIDLEGNEVTMKGVNPVHGDLKRAFKRLVPFLADLTEQKEAEHIDWSNLEGESNQDLLKRMDVTGITISGDEAFETVVMSGRRTLSVTTKVLCVNSPCISLDDEAGDYNRTNDLKEALDAVTGEAVLYITEHKYSVVQTEIDFDNVDDPFGNGGDAGESEPLKEESA